MSGGAQMGDNPLTIYSPPFSSIVFPHFTTVTPLYIYVKTTFSPLALSGGPVFYYLYYPAKKG